MLWERLTTAVGADARDKVWQHPDLLPEASDLDELTAFIDRILGGSSDIDSAIDQAIAEFQREAGNADDADD